MDIVIFALICVNVATSIESNMKTPKSFVSKFGVINSATATSVIAYTVFAFLGCLKYGATTQDSITLNLPSAEMYGISEIIQYQLIISYFLIRSTKFVQILLAAAMLMSYGLQLFVAVELVWGNVSKYFKNQFRGEIIVRVSTAIFTCELCHN